MSIELNNRFAALEHSFASLMEHVDKLAKRLDLPGPINQGVDIVISESSDVVTSNETIVKAAVFNFLVIFKMEDTLNNLLIIVMSLSAKIDNADLVWKFATCNICGINVSAKQKDIVWFLGAEMVIIINNSLAYHVFKIEEISGHLISVWLLFKGKMLIVILGLYTGASAETRFGQACEINSFIVKAVNSSIFTVLGENFNENGSKKSASFKFCLDLKLVNFFGKHSLVKAST
ncbi:hypothetical protein G9A89_006716 [Geosiphon pyriformis]|nr:hypothetical protein G9A89_006716 [Geosiphon pyriformis]